MTVMLRQSGGLAISRRLHGVNMLDNFTEHRHEVGLVIKYENPEDLALLQSLDIAGAVLELFDERPPNSRPEVDSQD
jgi:hypothetical protein